MLSCLDQQELNHKYYILEHLFYIDINFQTSSCIYKTLTIH